MSNERKMGLKAAILSLMQDGRERTTGEIAERVGSTRKNVGTLLTRARSDGLVTSDPIDVVTNGWRIVGGAK